MTHNYAQRLLDLGAARTAALEEAETIRVRMIQLMRQWREEERDVATLRHLASILGVSNVAVWKWLEDGRVP